MNIYTQSLLLQDEDHRRNPAHMLFFLGQQLGSLGWNISGGELSRQNEPRALGFRASALMSLDSSMDPGDTYVSCNSQPEICRGRSGTLHMNEHLAQRHATDRQARGGAAPYSLFTTSTTLTLAADLSRCARSCQGLFLDPTSSCHSGLVMLL